METRTRGLAIIKSRLCRKAAKGGDGRWPPLEKKEVPLKIVSPSLKTPSGEGFFAISPNFAAKICHTSRNVKKFPVRACNSGNAVLYSKHKCRPVKNPYRGFSPVCICALSIALRFRSCKRGQGIFLHFGWYDKFLRQNWAKWRKIPPRRVFSKRERRFLEVLPFSPMAANGRHLPLPLCGKGAI